MLLLVFKSVKIKSFLYTAKFIISLSLVLGIMPISNWSTDPFSRIFSVISDSSQWTSGIYCIRYPRGEGTRATHIPASNLSAEELREEIYPYLDPDNTNLDIDTVEVNRIPLDARKVINTRDIWTAFRIMQKFLYILGGYLSNAVYHAYVILKINGQYVSLEKHSDSLTIQISEDLANVLLKLRENPRSDVPEPIVEDRGDVNVSYLRDFIVNSEFVHEGYNVLNGNHCKKFAKGIFDEVALSQKYHWEEEERREKWKLATYMMVSAAIITAGFTSWMSF